MHTAGQLATGEETRDRFTLGIVYSRVGTNLESTHGVVQYWSLNGQL